jgi:tetratricopeptide (TPR) repeat protein
MTLVRVAAVAVLALVASGARAQPSDSTLQAGFTALQRGDGDAAARVFRGALVDHPRDPTVLYGAGYAAYLQGRDEEARDLLKRAVDIEPRLLQAAMLLGEIASRIGDLDLAIKTYEHVLALAPANTAVRARLDAWRSEAKVHSGFEAYKDDRFTIMFDGPAQQQLAARATTTLGAAFWRISATLGSSPASPITVIFYTQQQFRDITGAPEWAAGGFDGQIRLPLAGAATNLADFDRVLIHELTHAMVQKLAPRNVPAWLHEGLALHFEGHDAASAGRRLARARLMVPLRALEEGFSRLDVKQAMVAYDESAVAADALLARIGSQGLATLLADLDGGETIDHAVERFGFTLAAFERELATRLNIRPVTSRRPTSSGATPAAPGDSAGNR